MPKPTRSLYYNRKTPVISIPRDIVKFVGAKRNDLFAFEVDQAGRIILTRVPLEQLSASPKVAVEGENE